MENDTTYRVYDADAHVVKRIAFRLVDNAEGTEDTFPRSSLNEVSPLAATTADGDHDRETNFDLDDEDRHLALAYLDEDDFLQQLGDAETRSATLHSGAIDLSTVSTRADSAQDHCRRILKTQIMRHSIRFHNTHTGQKIAPVTTCSGDMTQAVIIADLQPRPLWRRMPSNLTTIRRSARSRSGKWQPLSALRAAQDALRLVSPIPTPHVSMVDVDDFDLDDDLDDQDLLDAKQDALQSLSDSSPRKRQRSTRDNKAALFPQMLRLRDEGKTITEVGKAVGLSRHAVGRTFKDNGMSFK